MQYYQSQICRETGLSWIIWQCWTLYPGSSALCWHPDNWNAFLLSDLHVSLCTELGEETKNDPGVSHRSKGRKEFNSLILVWLLYQLRCSEMLVIFHICALPNARKYNGEIIKGWFIFSAQELVKVQVSVLAYFMAWESDIFNVRKVSPVNL